MFPPVKEPVTLSIGSIYLQLSKLPPVPSRCARLGNPRAVLRRPSRQAGSRNGRVGPTTRPNKSFRVLTEQASNHINLSRWYTSSATPQCGINWCAIKAQLTEPPKKPSNKPNANTTSTSPQFVESPRPPASLPLDIGLAALMMGAVPPICVPPPRPRLNGVRRTAPTSGSGSVGITLPMRLHSNGPGRTVV